MPAPALPVPWGDPLPGSLTLRREYADILGRPMRGQVRITGTDGAPVLVKIDGVLEVSLPPGTYTLAADLRTVDGFKETRTDEVELVGPAEA